VHQTSVRSAWTGDRLPGKSTSQYVLIKSALICEQQQELWRVNLHNGLSARSEA